MGFQGYSAPEVGVPGREDARMPGCQDAYTGFPRRRELMGSGPRVASDLRANRLLHARFTMRWYVHRHRHRHRHRRRRRRRHRHRHQRDETRREDRVNAMIVMGGRGGRGWLPRQHIARHACAAPGVHCTETSERRSISSGTGILRQSCEFGRKDAGIAMMVPEQVP
jgi:hypothetical protein